MKNTIILIAMFLMSIATNGQISRTANVFTGVGITDTTIKYLDSINNLTAQCWAKHVGSSGTQAIFYNASTDMISGHSLNITLSLCFVGTTLTGRINDSSVYTTISDTSWHHVALIKSNDTMYLYVDGTLQAHKICPTHYYNFLINEFTVGSIDTSGTPHNIFNGNLNDLRIDTNVAAIHYDTCNYNGNAAFIYAAMNDMDSTHIYVNGTATAQTFNLSETSPCVSADTTTDTTHSHVGVANVSSEQSVNIYPNPTYDNTIHIAVNEVSLVIIYDMLGKEVYNNTINTTTAIHLTHGMYIVSVNNNKYKVIAQ